MKLQQILSKNNLVYIDSVEYVEAAKELRIRFLKNPENQKDSYSLLFFREVENFSETIDDLELDCLDSILGINESHKDSYSEYSITTEQRFMHFTTNQKPTLLPF